MSMGATFEDDTGYPVLFDQRMGRDPNSPPTTRERIRDFERSAVGQATRAYEPTTWRDIDRAAIQEKYGGTNIHGMALPPPSPGEPKAWWDTVVGETPADAAFNLGLGGTGRLAKGALALGGLFKLTDPAEAGISAQAAKAMRKQRAIAAGRRMGDTFEDTGANWTLPGIGHNNPPPEFALTAPTVPMTVNEANAAWMRGLPTPKPAATSTAIPDIRGLPVADAVAIARNQPHLVVAGEGSPGRYVGGPRDTKSKATLNATRRAFDNMVAEYPEGGMWYENYRPGISGTTNNTPLANLWASKMHGQWSAGVSPESETAFVLKELNNSIAGMPRSAYLGDQHQAFREALAAKDPNRMRLSKKTDEYARLVNPDQGVPGATGVDDFRYGFVHNFRNPEGGVTAAAFSDAQHRYLDYETALAVDRFNEMGMGGRSNWTGEQVQAAPWVVDKANDLQSRNPNLSRADALRAAMKTIVDYLPKHTYYAPHEAQPGASVVGHMTGSVNAPQSVRDQFALDPRSSWATAPGGRDAIYSGLGIEGTGAEMRVRSSLPMQGIFDVSGGTEYNLGAAARPLGGSQTPRKYDKEFIGPREYEPFKRAPDAERAILDAGEAVRGYIDAQAGSTWHKHWLGGPLNQSGSLFFPRSGPSTPQEMIALRDTAKQYGLGDVSDTGEGLTVTSWGSTPGANKPLDKALLDPNGPFTQFGTPHRTRVESGYIDYSDKFDKPGQGLATEHMLSYVNKTPELRDAFNRNPYLAERALAKFERDEAWAKQWGVPREDIQNARKIIAESKGDWLDRLEAAKKAGVILPATVLAIFAASQQGARDGEF